MKTGTVGRPYKSDETKGTVRVELRLTGVLSDIENIKFVGERE